MLNRNGGYNMSAGRSVYRRLIMKKCKIFSLILAAALAGTAAVGCSSGTKDSSSRHTQVSNNEELHDKEISVAIAEEADENSTVFKLNRVLESNQKDGRFIYLDVSISNAADKAYEMNCLNNFYILFDDGTEAHFDIRTQINAAQAVDGYTENPFEIPANGEFSGVIGGFIVPESVQSFTVCFFPTLDDMSNKSSVVKVKIDGSSIVKLN